VALRGERGTPHDSLDLVAQERDGLGIALVDRGDVQAQEAQLARDPSVVPEAPHPDVVEVARAMDRRARARLGDDHGRDRRGRGEYWTRVARGSQRLGRPVPRPVLRSRGRVAPDPEPRSRDGPEIGAGCVPYMIAAAEQGEIALCEPLEKGPQLFDRVAR
jgi:hypothetical protein